MNGKQSLIAFLGVFLIILTVWFEWRQELSTILFNAPVHSGSTDPGLGGILKQDPSMGAGALPVEPFHDPRSKVPS